MPAPILCLQSNAQQLSVSDQVNQHHYEDGEQHGDDEEIAKDFDADLASGHFNPGERARLVPIGIATDLGTALAAG
jgi:hypothetical protein